MTIPQVKVVVLSGGRGSLALHFGLRRQLRARDTSHSIVSIVNAYDDGKSTGAVRKLVPGGMLGPSDVRKLQFAQFECAGGDPATARLFDYRIKRHDSSVPLSLRSVAAGRLLDDELGFLIRGVPDNIRKLVQEALSYIVRTPDFDTLRFDDFSFPNLVYAGLAGLNSNDLQAAEAQIRRELGICDAVLLNSRENLYLCGLTEGGEVLADEASIVDYSGPAPIYEIFLAPLPPSPSQLAALAALDGFEARLRFMRSNFSAYPTLSLPARDALLDADLVIYSAGTQHSSLYPTYMTRGLSDALCRSKAVKVMVTNIRHDNEIPDFRAADIVRQAIFYLNEKGRQSFAASSLIDALIVNDPRDSAPTLVRPNRTQLERLGIADIRYIHNLEDSQPGNHGRHDADRLAAAVLDAFLAGKSNIATARRTLTAGPLAFDLDDTLFLDRRNLMLRGRTGQALDVDSTNIALLLELMEKGFQVALISGNDFRVIIANFVQVLLSAPGATSDVLRRLTIYADGATTKHQYSPKTKLFEAVPGYAERHRIDPDHRGVIGSILDAALERLRRKYPSLEDLHLHYDPRLFSYAEIPARHFVRGDYSQMVVKPIPSEWHSRAGGDVHDERRSVANSIEEALRAAGLADRYTVLQRGWGSIEVQDRTVDKFTALSDFLAESGASLQEVVYFGNELDPRDGNDFPIAQRGANVIAVSREEGALPLLPNVVYGGHRGTASTSLHLEGMLELFESELERVRSGGGAPKAPVTVIYMNRLLRQKLDSERNHITQDPLSENAFLKRALAAVHGSDAPA